MSDPAREASADGRTEATSTPARMWQVALTLAGPPGRSLHFNRCLMVELPMPELMMSELAVRHLLDVVGGTFMEQFVGSKLLSSGELTLPDQIRWERGQDGCWTTSIGLHASEDDETIALYAPLVEDPGTPVTLRVTMKPVRPDLVIDLSDILDSSHEGGSPARSAAPQRRQPLHRLEPPPL